ncbi:hypothetical protein BaRGS_00018509 [Batillaria attramentaria]|uniref:Uncharacterized protein n=1 Tax=Batillaria attramentaria TaxID=370345 RepID=A0ABD0KTC5_9CAEN
MFYKFNSMMGRITASTQLEAYIPQGLTPAAREPSRIVFESKKTAAVHEPAAAMQTRPLSSTPMSTPLSSAEPGKTPGGVIPTHHGYRKIQELQNLFLKQDGLMVWQKFGRDRALYGATIGLTVLGFTVAFAQLYTMAFPPKNE